MKPIFSNLIRPLVAIGALGAFHCCGIDVASQNPVPPADLDKLPAAEQAERLLTLIKSQNVNDIWDEVNLLVRIGRSDGGATASKLETTLKNGDEKLKLACARALCQLGQSELAGNTLADLIEHGAASEIRKLAANSAALATSLSGSDKIITALANALKNERDELVQVALARCQMRMAKGAEGREALRALLNTSTDCSVRDEAALVLAENGQGALPEVRTRVLTLFSEPTERGERALNVLKTGETLRQPFGPGAAKGLELLQELLLTIAAAYPDDAKVKPEKLLQDAAKGMVKGLDQFSAFLDPEEARTLQESLAQDYAGIGAFVGLRDNQFIITSPLFKSPAYEAGLRALDVIQEIDGVKVSAMLEKGGIAEVTQKMKGKLGTPVKLKYMRRGNGKAVEVTLIRSDIKVDSVYSAMLPGRIAYVRLTRFGERSAREMKAALDELVRKQGAKALVFDLRDNGGGLLRAGVDVADLFLGGKKLIVYSEGKKEFAPRRDYFSSGGAEDELLPMVTLVGPGSASASEIVAGALQDHQRCALVGEKTFGKGSVQQIMDLRTVKTESKLRLTIARYYLPSGRCIHEKGIEPDITVKPNETNGWILESMIELRKKGLFEDFIRGTWEANRGQYLKLALYDCHDCSAWPGFEEFYKKLDTAAPRQDVRTELRYVARHLAQDSHKNEFAMDIEEDRVLQRGVWELLKKTNTETASIPEYKDFSEKFKADAE